VEGEGLCTGADFEKYEKKCYNVETKTKNPKKQNIGKIFISPTINF